MKIFVQEKITYLMSINSLSLFIIIGLDQRPFSLLFILKYLNLIKFNFKSIICIYFF